MKFCKTCGYGMDESATVCTNCNNEMNEANTLSDDKLKVLSERIKINGIIWLIIGICQVIMFVNPLSVVVGVLNIFSAIRDLKTSKNVFHYRVGLVNAYKPIVSPIITLIYNLVFGWIFGVAGSIYYFVAIRGYVMENADYFNTLK